MRKLLIMKWLKRCLFVTAKLCLVLVAAVILLVAVAMLWEYISDDGGRKTPKTDGVAKTYCPPVGLLGQVSGTIKCINTTYNDTFRIHHFYITDDGGIMSDNNGGAGHNNMADSTMSMPSDNNQH